MFEKAEPTEDLKTFLAKWKGQPSEPSLKDKAHHWSDVLGINKDFFFDTSKLTEAARDRLFRETPSDADRYHELWEALRENGWRRTQDRDGTWNWSCIYPHLVRHKTDRVFTATEKDQERWESDYYDNEFIKEAP